MSNQVKMPKRQTFKKTKLNLLEDIVEVEENEDVQEKEEMEKEKERSLRWKRYFFKDGTCRAHDRELCPECSRWAAAYCPSHWEEK